MPEGSMKGHVKRLHSMEAAIGTQYAPKRSYAEIEAEEPLFERPATNHFGTVTNENYTVSPAFRTDPMATKRHCQRLDSVEQHETMAEPFIQQPQTTPIETAPVERESFSNRAEDYNLVHISDRELNKFLRRGLIRIANGHLYMKDTEYETPAHEI